MNDFSAFPIPLDDRPGAYPAEPGMSFRDAAALHALPSIMPLCVTDTRADGESQEDLFARKSYAVADAMLKARVRAVQATVSMDLHNRIVQRLEWLIHDQPINVQEFAADVRELLRTAGVALPATVEVPYTFTPEQLERNGFGTPGVQGRPAFPLMDPQRRRELDAASGVALPLKEHP